MIGTTRALALILILIAAFPPRSSARVELRPEGFYVDGAYFYPVGVNYMPRDTAVYIWKEFDPEAVREEFRALAGLGLNTVRTFVFWDDLNPAPGEVSAENLDQIARLMDVAQEEGIMVILTLYTGHMSGVNWFPPWMKPAAGQAGVYQKEYPLWPRLKPRRRPPLSQHSPPPRPRRQR